MQIPSFFLGFYSSYYIGTCRLPMFDQSFLPNPRSSVISHSYEPSQSKSSKITDWIQKPENAEDKNNHDTFGSKVVEEPPRPIDNTTTTFFWTSSRLTGVKFSWFQYLNPRLSLQIHMNPMSYFSWRIPFFFIFSVSAAVIMFFTCNSMII